MKFRKDKKGLEQKFSTAEIKVKADCRGYLNGYCIPLQFFPCDVGCRENCTSYRKPIDEYEEKK